MRVPTKHYIEPKCKNKYWGRTLKEWKFQLPNKDSGEKEQTLVEAREEQEEREVCGQ